MTSYETLYNRCLSKIEDPTLAMLSDNDMDDMLHGWMLSAIAKHRKCEHDMSDRDDELRQFNFDMSDLELEILAILMCREWVSQQLNSVTLTLQVFSGKETTYFSQAAHLKELQALDDKWRLEAQQLSRDYTYTNSDYFD
nr:MAG TPA: hypothetical protein [Caudoviricetes sp.]